MKKAIIAFTILTATVIAACNNSASTESKKDSTATTSTTDTSKVVSAVKYTCTMHPDVISDTPGNCPKCGMELVPIKDSAKQ